MQEMKNYRPAFEVWEKRKEDLPIGYQEIKCNMIFDIKLGENFRIKARLVGGGHTTTVSASITYSSIVSRDSVLITLNFSALNGLEILACDIKKYYLTVKCRDLIWTTAGPEFGTEEGSIMVVKNGSLWPEIIRGSVQIQVGKSPARHRIHPILSISICMDETSDQIRRNGKL